MNYDLYWDERKWMDEKLPAIKLLLLNQWESRFKVKCPRRKLQALIRSVTSHSLRYGNPAELSSSPCPPSPPLTQFLSVAKFLFSLSLFLTLMIRVPDCFKSFSDRQFAFFQLFEWRRRGCQHTDCNFRWWCFFRFWIL